MADVGLGQLATATGRYRSKKLRDAVTDATPLMQAAKDKGGIRRIAGGRTVLDEAKTGTNSTTSWVGENGVVPLTDAKIIDSPEFDWKYQLAAVVWTLAEKYKNSGAYQYHDIVGTKFEVAEDSMMNQFHEGMLSAGTGSGGLQLNGLASLVSTTPTTGTVGGIDRSNANAAWFRNQKFDTATDWSDGSVDAGNVKRFLNKALDATSRNSASSIDLFLMGSTHWDFAQQAFQAVQVINDNSGTGKLGFDKLVFRGVPIYFGGGVNFSGYSALTATRTYGLCLKPGGVNLVFHNEAEFSMLNPVESADQAAISRLLFTMAAMTIGGLAKFNWVGFD